MKRILFLLLLIQTTAAAQSIQLKELAAQAVQGKFNRSNYTLSANGSLVSGFDGFLDEAVRPGGQPLGWPWHRITIRSGATAASQFRTELIFHFKTNAAFERNFDEQVGSFTPFKRIHTNRWLPFKEDQTYQNGDTFIFLNGEFQRSTRSYTFAGAATTLDPTVTEYLTVYNTAATAIPVLLDATKAWFGCRVTIKFYPDSNAGSSIVVSSNNGSYIENDARSFASSYTLSGGINVASWVFSSGGQWERVR